MKRDSTLKRQFFVCSNDKDFLWRELTPIILFIELDKSVTEGTKADPFKPGYILNIHSGKYYYVLVLIFVNWIFHPDLESRS